MRILMFGWEFPPFNSGGLGVACLGLTRGLAESGASVLFVLPRKMKFDDAPVEMLFADERAPHLKIKYVDSLLSPYLTAADYLKNRGLATGGLYGAGLFQEVVRYALSVPAIIKGEEFDIIHAHDWLAFPAGIEAKKLSGKPLVVHVHATEFDRSGEQRNQTVYDIEKRGMEEADEVVAVSEHTKNILMKGYGIPASKITVVHNAIDPSEFEKRAVSEDIIRLKKDHKKIVISVGRITMQKGIDYFVRTAKRVLEYMPDVYFVVSGSGDMEQQIIQQVASLGLSDRFFFTGFVRGEELRRIYELGDLFVMPSVSEPFGLTPLESLLHGTPVIVSKQSGVSEVLFHALKADFWDIDDMSDKIIAVLRNEPLKRQLAEGGKKDTLRTSWKTAAEKCMMVYKKLMQKFHKKIF